MGGRKRLPERGAKRRRRPVPRPISQSTTESQMRCLPRAQCDDVGRATMVLPTTTDGSRILGATSTTNAAWNASSASVALPNTRRHVPRTSAACRFLEHRERSFVPVFEEPAGQFTVRGRVRVQAGRNAAQPGRNGRGHAGLAVESCPNVPARSESVDEKCGGRAKSTRGRSPACPFVTVTVCGGEVRARTAGARGTPWRSGRGSVGGPVTRARPGTARTRG